MPDNKGSFSGISFSKASFTLGNLHYVAKPDEKILTNVSGENLNISGKLKEIEINKDAQTPIKIVFGNEIYYQPTLVSHDISQNYTINNILTSLNFQTNISNETKTKIELQVKEFVQECTKGTPDEGKLKGILSSIYPLAKDVGLKLFAFALDKGYLNF